MPIDDTATFWNNKEDFDIQQTTQKITSRKEKEEQKPLRRVQDERKKPCQSSEDNERFKRSGKVSHQRTVETVVNSARNVGGI